MNKNNDDYINIGESVKNLKHIYKKTTYFKSYGTSIFIFILITFIFFLFFSYLNVKNHLHKYQSDPAKYRCEPSVMPFAGHIFPHPGMTNSQFNRSNIMYCMREVLKDMLGEILLPFEYISQLIQNIHSINFGSLDFLRTIFSDIRNIIVYLASAFIKTITIPLSVLYASDIVIYCLRILAKRLLTWIITTLTILGLFITTIFIAIFLAVFFAVDLIPFVGPVLAPILATMTSFGIASIFLVTYVVISVIYGEIAHAVFIGLDVTSELAPPPPKLRPPNVGRGRRRRR